MQVEFEQGDPRNPENFTKTRKWTITLTAIAFTAISGARRVTKQWFLSRTRYRFPGANAATYPLGEPDMIRDLNCTQFQATIGLSLTTLGIAITPLFTVAFSEEFGRQPLYLVSCFGYAMMLLIQAL